MTEKAKETAEILNVSMEVIVSNENIDDIMVCALEGGINYWCNEAEVVGKYLGEFGSEQISRGGVLKLYDSEEEKVYELTREKFMNGLRTYLSAGNTGCLEIQRKNYGLPTGKLLVDTCNVDAGVADAIIQYAVFNEIIYG